MNLSTIKLFLIAPILSLLAYSVHAENATQPAPSFQENCVNSWMKKGDEAKDKVDYKDFGEKYCGCAASQKLDSEEAVKKAIQLCLSRTLLHDAMDAMDEEVGLAESKDTDVQEYCEDRWTLIYPKQTDEDKKFTTAYCECAKPKLLDLIKKSDNLTDKQYDEVIDKVADECSSQ
ncbi:hypothetical protein [Legionella waltersii]|uniref:Uncharacterized protein n=1 Tax=Legionella waltersii TaxID=66969 RepID=A0A0W1ANW5_9GAMM|nr:hypothetical protein [Legionella waltersii]KTD82958.1 hypothetical protein Lwal_0177 [Legionella waltersii]SNU97324.1 Uncharacterised protein [Legionella waltersii]